jgi:hypothetical protein
MPVAAMSHPAALAVAALGPAPAAEPKQQTLPQRARVVVKGPRWMFIGGGAAIGALVCGLPGALLGAVLGAMLTR